MSFIYLSKIGVPHDGIKFIWNICFLFIDKRGTHTLFQTPTMQMVQIHLTHPVSGAVVTQPVIRPAGGGERWS
jgi:hypothetical protein